jgi:hypothetical protein
MSQEAWEMKWAQAYNDDLLMLELLPSVMVPTNTFPLLK